MLWTWGVFRKDGLDSVSRGWGSVGRRLAGATLSLPALDVDDEAEPLHATINASLRPAPQTGDQSASANKTAQPHPVTGAVETAADHQLDHGKGSFMERLGASMEKALENFF